MQNLPPAPVPDGTLVTEDNFVFGALVTRSSQWSWGDTDFKQPMMLSKVIDKSVNSNSDKSNDEDDATDEGETARLLRALAQATTSLSEKNGNNSNESNNDSNNNRNNNTANHQQSEKQKQKKKEIWIECINAEGKPDIFRAGAQDGAYDLVYGTTPQPPLKPHDPPNELVGKNVTAANFVEGALVSRGPDWIWKDQDKAGPGILVRKQVAASSSPPERRSDMTSPAKASYNDAASLLSHLASVLGVRTGGGGGETNNSTNNNNDNNDDSSSSTSSSSHAWAYARFGDNGRDNCYRIGINNAFDLVYGPDPSPAQLEIDAPSELLGKPVTATNFVTNAAVCRGPAWRFGYQDSGKHGRLLRLEKNAMIAWVRWSHDSAENRYPLAPEGQLMYGRVPAQPPELPLFKGKFSLADRWRGIDASQSGDVTCTASRHCSVFTEQIFDIATSDFEVTFDIRELHEGIGGLGIMKESSSIELAARHIVGEVELEGSLGIGIENGKSFILQHDSKTDVTDCCTTGSTLLGMRILNGAVSFSIDGQEFETNACLMDFEGMYRVIVSFTKPNQKGLFATKRNPSSAGAKNNNNNNSHKDDDDDGDHEIISTRNNTSSSENDSSSSDPNSIPNVIGIDTGNKEKPPHHLPISQLAAQTTEYKSKFTFWDWLRCIDVQGSEKQDLLCRQRKRGTVVSREVFDISSTRFEHTLHLRGGILGGHVCIGIVPVGTEDHPTLPENASRFFCGEREVPGSVALLLRDDAVSVLSNDDISDTSLWITTCDTAVTIRVNNGTLAFDIDGRSLDLDSLTKRNFTGKHRLAVSLCYEGQYVTFDADKGKSTNAGGPTIPMAVWTKGKPFTFHDYVRSIDVIGNQREIIARDARRATVFTKQIFDFRYSDFEETITFHGGLRADDGESNNSANNNQQSTNNDLRTVAFGICGIEPGRAIGGALCGEKEINCSIALLLRRGVASILHKDRIVDAEPCPTSINEDTRVTITISHSGELSFKLNGKEFCSPYLRRLKFNGFFRLACSLSNEGQRATLIGGNIPHHQWVDGSPFTFHNFVQSMDVETKNIVANNNNNNSQQQQLEVIKCNRSARATIFSREVFNAPEAAFARSFTIHGGTKGGDIAIGLVDENPSVLVSDHIVGERELANSLAFILRPGRAGILHHDSLKDMEVCRTELRSNETMNITMTFNHGRMSFQLNGKDFQAPAMNSMLFTSKWRIGISLTQKNQKVTVSDPTLSLDIPRSPWRGANHRFSLLSACPDALVSPSGFAAWIKNSNSSNDNNNNNNQTTLLPRRPLRTTVFSEQVFDLSADTVSQKCVFVGGLHGGDVAFGFISEHPPQAVSTHLAGEVELPNSVGILLRAGSSGLVPRSNSIRTACVLHLDKLVDKDDEIMNEVSSSDNNVDGDNNNNRNNNNNHDEKDISVRLNISGGRLSAMINNRNLHMPSFDDKILEGKCRLAISMTVPGQKCFLEYSSSNNNNNNNENNDAIVIIDSFETAGGSNDDNLAAPTLQISSPAASSYNNQQSSNENNNNNASSSSSSSDDEDVEDENPLRKMQRLLAKLQKKKAQLERANDAMLTGGQIRDDSSNNNNTTAAAAAQGTNAVIDNKNVENNNNNNNNQESISNDENTTTRNSATKAEIDDNGDNNNNTGQNQNDETEEQNNSNDTSSKITVSTQTEENTTSHNENRETTTNSNPTNTTSSIIRTNTKLFPNLPARVQIGLFSPSSLIPDATTHCSVYAPIKISPQFSPPDILLSDDLLSKNTLLELIPQLPYMIEESMKAAKIIRVVSNRDESNHNQNNNNKNTDILSMNEAFAVSLYTFDLGLMSETDDGSDNFFFIVNRELRNRTPAVLISLRSFFFYFQSAWKKLPHYSSRRSSSSSSSSLTSCYRAFPSSCYDEVNKNFSPKKDSSDEDGNMIYWSSFVSASSNEGIFHRYRERFLIDGDSDAKKPTLVKIQVCDARMLVRTMSSVSRSDERTTLNSDDTCCDEILFYPGSQFEIVSSSDTESKDFFCVTLEQKI